VLLGLLSYYLIFSCLSVNANESKINRSINEISLLICAKNELENLQNHLGYWLNQKEIKHQIIIVNDNSTDGSTEWLTEQSQKYEKLQVVHLENHDKAILKGKRYALLAGLKVVKTDYVVFSDADCYPKSVYWLREMANAFKKNTAIVLGYSPYVTKNNLLGNLIDYETSLTALQYLSFAKIGHAYMGVGRNIAYKTSVLEEKCFLASNKSTGGDDDLLVAEITTPFNTEIVLSSNSVVYTLPEENFKDWRAQKTRHYKASKHYSFKNKCIAGVFPMLNVLFYMILVTIFFKDFSIFPLLILYLFKHLLFLTTNYKNLKIFKITKIKNSIWYLDLLLIVIIPIFHMTSNYVNRDVWKEK